MNFWEIVGDVVRYGLRSPLDLGPFLVIPVPSVLVLAFIQRRKNRG